MKRVYILLVIAFSFLALGTYAQPILEVRDHALDNRMEQIGVDNMRVVALLAHPGFKSCDIWVRLNDDDGTEHQNPDCTRELCWVYFRVTNITDERSSGFDYTDISWNAAAVTSNVQMSGNGEYPTLGGTVSNNIRIPALDPGEEIIIKIPWNVPCDPTHFCLRVCVNSEDGMEFVNDHAELIYRKDCAQRNVDIINPVLGIPISSAKILARNWWDYDRVFNLRLAQSPISFYPNERILDDMSLEEILHMEPIFEKANVFLTMDDVMIEAWERGGGNHSDGVERIDRNVFKIHSNDAYFDKLIMSPGEMGYFNFTVDFFELNPDTEYEFDLILSDADKEDEILGIETFSVMKNDGKEYEEIKANIIGIIKELYPNPASDELSIYSYFENIEAINRASIRITNILTTYSNVYELDVTNPELHLNISDLPNGTYVVYLICDGVILDYSTFIKE